MKEHFQMEIQKCDHNQSSSSCEFSNGILRLNCGCQWCFSHFNNLPKNNMNE